MTREPAKPSSAQVDLERARMRPAGDPPTRRDGRCVVCRGERKPIALEHDDPFCSTTCARSYYRLEGRDA